jgi:hypothetical protein
VPLLVLRRAHVFVVPPTLVFTDYEGREGFRDAVADSPLLHLASHSITPLCSEAKGGAGAFTMRTWCTVVCFTDVTADTCGSWYVVYSAFYVR